MCDCVCERLGCTATAVIVGNDIRNCHINRFEANGSQNQKVALLPWDVVGSQGTLGTRAAQVGAPNPLTEPALKPEFDWVVVYELAEMPEFYEGVELAIAQARQGERAGYPEFNKVSKLTNA